MRNEIVDHRVQKERERFINTIDQASICRLASSYHNGESCSIFKERAHGSYNLCIYVAFSSSGDRWVVRIPIVPCLASVDEKLAQEVGAMRCVAERTTIPLPQIHAYSFQRESPIGLAFLIIDFVEGRTLQDIDIRSLSAGQRAHLYEQLADVEIQLRRQEFPHIGALSIGPDAETQWTSNVPRRPLSIELNGQEVEGLHVSRICEKQKVYTSATGYINSLISLAFHQFKEGQNSVEDEYDACVTLYSLCQFQAIVEEWINQDLVGGPFVLMHGDLRPPNIILNDRFDIVAVIDWEWSRIVPVQLFVPPTWFSGREVEGICSPYGHLDYIQELDTFRAILVNRERLYDEGPLLSKEWSKIHRKGRFLIAAALNNPALIDTVYSGYLDSLQYAPSSIGVRANEFIGGSEEYRNLVERKVRDRMSYEEELMGYLANMVSRYFGQLAGFWTSIFSQRRIMRASTILGLAAMTYLAARQYAKQRFIH